MSDGPSLASLPPELLWTIADMLLDGTGSVFNVGRLALVCTATMFLLADDKTWRARCRRHFGRARTNIHAHAERFGVRWVHIYVSMANVMTPDGSAGLSKCPRRTWACFRCRDCAIGVGSSTVGLAVTAYTRRTTLQAVRS